MAIGALSTTAAGGAVTAGKLTRYAVFSCMAGAIGGLIFGYDLGITGGVTSMAPFLEAYFPSVYRQQAAAANDTNQYCKFDSQILTLFTSSLYLAALVSSLGAGWVTRKYGRRVSMLAGGAVFMVGSLLNALAVPSRVMGLAMLILGRVLLGFGVGFANQSVPLYVSEMAPPKHRGAFNNLFQLSITLGIFIANLINYGTAKLPGSSGWRVSLGLAAVPAALMIIFSLFLPDTPSSLLDRGQAEEARRVLRRVRGLNPENTEIETEFAEMVAASEASKKVEAPWRNLLTRKHRPHLVMAVLIPFFQQMTGMNIVVFYAPELFNSIGIGKDASLASALITGGFNMIATFVAIYLVDRKGRRFLFLEGGIQMLITQIAVAALIGSKFGTTGAATEISKGFGIGVVTIICVFVMGFAWSWGPLGWLVPSEIFPLEVRSAGQSVVVAVNMLMTFVLGQVFLTLLCHLKFGLFVIFAAFILGMTLFVYFLVPETKGLPIEDVQKVFEEHRVWKKYVQVADRGDAKLRGLELGNVATEQ
ncbi:hypothetical protein V2J09_007518 [Rumex salicifolius]